MLTEAQRKVFTAIVQLVALRQRSPKYFEIGRKLGLRSGSTVHKHVTALIRKGYLTRPAPRELEVVPVTLRNGLEYRSCDRGHAMCWFQVERCPACCKVILDEDF